MLGMSKVVLIPPEIYGGDNLSCGFTVYDGKVTVETVSYYRKSDGQIASTDECGHVAQTGEKYVVCISLKAGDGNSFGLDNSGSPKASDVEVSLIDGTRLSPVYENEDETEKSCKFSYEMEIRARNCWLRCISENEMCGKVNYGSGYYPCRPGQKLKLTAAPNAGYSFVGWYRNHLPYDLQNKSITIEKKNSIEEYVAKFACFKFKSCSNNERLGKVYVRGEYPCEVGKRIKLTAYPETGCTFLGWYEGESLLCKEREILFEKKACDQVFEARFAQYMLKCSSNKEKLGFAYVNGRIIKDAIACAQGTKLKLCVTSGAGVAFLGWYRNGNVYDEKNRDIIIEKDGCDEEYEARFACYTLKCVSNNEILGRVSFNGVHLRDAFYCTPGTKAMLKAEPTADTTFLGWYRNGIEYDLGNKSITIEKEACDEEYVAKFCRYSLDCCSNNESYGKTSRKGNFVLEAGRKIALTATPFPGCHFLGWLINNSEVNTNREITIEKKACDEKYVACFSRYAFKITSPHRTVHPDIVLDYDVGTKIMLSADIPQDSFGCGPLWERKLGDGPWVVYNSTDYEITVTKASCDEEIRFSYKNVK